MEKYPSFLPLAQLTKTQNTGAGFRENVPSIGLPVFEKLTDDLPVSFSLKWIFTRQQARTFEAFIRTAIDNGSQWFEMPINIGASGVQTQVVHFTVGGFPQKTDRNAVIEYQATVVVKELNDPTVGDDIFYLLPDDFSDILERLINVTTPKYGSKAP